MDAFEPAGAWERALYTRAAKSRTPVSGSIELTPLCNMDCAMCFVRLSPAQMAQKGRLRTAQEWLEAARQMQRAGLLFLLLTGGEPLTYPGFRELYVGLRAMGISVILNTNGTLIDEDWADFFARNPPRRVNVTLYGKDADAYKRLCRHEGGFEAALRGVRLLKARGVKVKLNGSLTVENAGDLEAMANIARELDCPMHTDTYMYPAERERDQPYNLQARLAPEIAGAECVHAAMLEMQPAEFMRMAAQTLYLAANTPAGEGEPLRMRCRAGRSSFAINWQGEMRPCLMLTSPSVNVFEQGFDRGWEAVCAGVDAIRMSPACGSCRLREVCGVCAASALYDGGGYDEPPAYVCRYTGAMLQTLAMIAERISQQENAAP